MAKRSASLQLTNENWDQEEEDEEPGQFKPAAVTSIQNRVIRKAKRRLGETEGASSSPFSAFTGFKNHNTEPFTFGKPMSSSAKSDKQNGSDLTEKKTSSQSTFEPQPLKRSHMSDDAKSEPKNLEHFRQLQQLNESVLKWMQTHMSKNPYCDFTPVFKDYMGHLSKLEKAYPLKSQSSSDMSSSTIPKFGTSAPSFKMPESSSSEPSGLANTSANTIAKSGFSNFMKSVKCSDEESAKDNNDFDPEMSYGAGFKSNTTNTSTFSSGIKKSLTATSSGSPIGPASSFSAEAKDTKSGDDEEKSKDEGDAEKKTAPTFSFGATKFGSSSAFNKKDNEKSEAEPFRFSSAMCGAKPFSFAAAQKSSESAAEENEYVPPKNEVNLVVEDDVLFSKRCKLFFKRDNTFVDKGVGTLYLKPLDGKTQLLVRADTNLGNILLNIMLTSSLPIEKTGKNNVLIVCVPNPPIDAKKPDSKEAIPMLIRVKASTDADELFEVLNKHKS